MPHFGEMLALVGTMRADGVVLRYYNSLTTVIFGALLMEAGGYLLLETGERFALDP